MKAEDGRLLCFFQHPPFFEHATLGGLLYEEPIALLELRILGHVHFAGMVACQTLRLRCTLCSDAGVAQSAEQRFCKPQVGGSIPLASSMLPADIPTSSESFAPPFCPSHSVTVTVFVTILVFSRSKNSLSDRAARSRSASFTMLYLSNVARVLCPDIVIVIVSGTPALSMFLSPDLRRS